MAPGTDPQLSHYTYSIWTGCTVTDSSSNSGSIQSSNPNVYQKSSNYEIGHPLCLQMTHCLSPWNSVCPRHLQPFGQFGAIRQWAKTNPTGEFIGWVISISPSSTTPLINKKAPSLSPFTLHVLRACFSAWGLTTEPKCCRTLTWCIGAAAVLLKAEVAPFSKQSAREQGRHGEEAWRRRIFPTVRLVSARWRRP